jgi:hypothetical protein
LSNFAAILSSFPEPTQSSKHTASVALTDGETKSTVDIDRDFLEFFWGITLTPSHAGGVQQRYSSKSHCQFRKVLGSTAISESQLF